jgi:uncharacterized membrane protein YfcA
MAGFRRRGLIAMDNFFIFVLVGFLAQIIDGALGMAYGVSSTTFLLSFGISPAIASASVHTAEAFTTMVSGLSHLKLKNVDKSLLKRLIIPGIIGGVTGAYFLSSVSGDKIKPFITGYLVVMGLVILLKAFKKAVPMNFGNRATWGLGLAGGFFDAIGGGGWGPIVTSTLVAGGFSPRYAIGTVNCAEFFVTVAQVASFITFIGIMQNWQGIVGLAVGGVIAAPLAALVCQKLPTKWLMAMVGALVVLLNVRTLLQLY